MTRPLLCTVVLFTAAAAGCATTDARDPMAGDPNGKADGTGDEVTALERGQFVQVSGGSGSQRVFSLELPQDETIESLGVRLNQYGHDEKGHSLGEIEGAWNGDADLYIRRGAPPTRDEHDFKAAVGGNQDEVVTVGGPEAGTWFILVDGYEGDFTVELFADYATRNEATGGAGQIYVGDHLPHLAERATDVFQHSFGLVVEPEVSQAEMRVYVPFGTASISAIGWEEIDGVLRPTAPVDSPDITADRLTYVYTLSPGRYEFRFGNSAFFGGILAVE